MATSKKNEESLKDQVGTVIEEGDIIAYAVTQYRSAALRIGTVAGFTDKSIRVEVPQKIEEWKDGKYVVTGVEMKKMSVSKDKRDNVIVVTKKAELDSIDRFRAAK